LSATLLVSSHTTRYVASALSKRTILTKFVATKALPSTLQTEIEGFLAKLPAFLDGSTTAKIKLANQVTLVYTKSILKASNVSICFGGCQCRCAVFVIQFKGW
jgi:hypothetical protein